MINSTRCSSSFCVCCFFVDFSLMCSILFFFLCSLQGYPRIESEKAGWFFLVGRPGWPGSCLLSERMVTNDVEGKNNTFCSSFLSFFFLTNEGYQAGVRSTSLLLFLWGSTPARLESCCFFSSERSNGENFLITLARIDHVTSTFCMPRPRWCCISFYAGWREMKVNTPLFPFSLHTFYGGNWLVRCTGWGIGRWGEIGMDYRGRGGD